MKGKILKGIAGFYYVYVGEPGTYACKAKGIFRKDKIKPLVGDDVIIEVTHEGDKEGNIVEILPRKNSLVRPAVANVDQALVIFAVTKPEPNFHLLDRFLVTMERQQVPTLICFNKIDFTNTEQMAYLRSIYEPAGYEVLFISAKDGTGFETLREHLQGRTTTVAGPSGVGKSTTINRLAPHQQMETGDISEKIDRGRHTTRHSEIITLDDESFIIDTPGFTSLYIDDIERSALQDYFPEIAREEPNCKFIGCSHIAEPSCGVKVALEKGRIHEMRYEHYCSMYEQLKDKKKY